MGLRLHLLLFGCLLPSYVSYAQTSPTGRPTVVPPSPTAAALERYGQVPVGTYTGVPAISVPLYDIKVRDLDIPLSLSYHAGGFRVMEEASWVGLGWSLLAGSAITRTVRNLDDLGGFYLNYPGNFTSGPFNMPDPTYGTDWAVNLYGDIHSYNGNGFNAGNTYAGAMGIMHSEQTIAVNKQLVYNGDAIKDQKMDWEPDDFRYAAGAYSGQFAFKQDGSLHVLEQQKVKIERLGNTITSGWKVTTPDGYRYYYDAPEITTTVDPNTLKGPVTTAWYLTRLVSPLGEVATFSYDRGPETYAQPSLSQTETKQTTGTCDAAAQMNQTEGFSLGHTTPQYLRRIDFKTGAVVLEREANRLDLQGGERLSRLTVLDQAGRVLRRFDLQASYFEVPTNARAGFATSYASLIAAAYRPDPSFENNRLRLDAVQESGADGVAKPPTRFTYSDMPLPAKTSFNVDYWGFNNGRGNSTLIPSYAGPDLFGQYTKWPGADRTPDSVQMQAGILRQVTYPTGGSTTYAFEPHAYGNFSDADAQVITDYLAVRLRLDNTNASNNLVADTIRLATQTPVDITYDIQVRDASPNSTTNKSETGLRLIDNATGRIYSSGSQQALWTFTEGERSDPNVQRIGATVTLVLPAGKYSLQAISPGAYGAGCPVLIEARASYPVLVKVADTDNVSRLAGGLRVRRIVDHDGVDASRDQVTTFQYGSYGPNARGKSVFQSSGILLTQPVFKKVLHHSLGVTDGGQAPECGSLQLTSYSDVCFSAGARGGSVGYTQVVVIRGAHGEGGKKEYRFSCLPDRTLEYSNSVASVPTRADDLNGYPTAEITYRRTLEGYSPVSRVDYQYSSPRDQYQYDLPGMSRGSSWVANASSTKPVTMGYFYYYPIPVRWVRLQGTATTNFDPSDSSKTYVTSTRYTYDTLNVGHRQVSQTRTLRSDGSTLVTTTTYPADYTGVSSGPLAAMRSDSIYQHAAPVEIVRQVYGARQTLADARVIGGTYTEYTKPVAGRRFLPSGISTLDVAQPTAGLAPVFSSLALPPANRYRLFERRFYDPVTANLQQVQPAHGSPTAYLWGYAGTLPVAQVQNASARQTAAAWAATGLDLSQPYSETALRQALGVLRQRLPQAHVTGFTHQPLVGLSSQVDASGRFTYFEYDGLQRLLRTRDEQGRILSQQVYHYAGQ